MKVCSQTDSGSPTSPMAFSSNSPFTRLSGTRFVAYLFVDTLCAAFADRLRTPCCLLPSVPRQMFAP